jgi:hypothetical protein
MKTQKKVNEIEITKMLDGACSPEELIQPIEFEKIEAVKVRYQSTPIKIINSLLGEIRKLNDRIDFLEKKKGIVSSAILKRIWDNEDDAEWDKI